MFLSSRFSVLVILACALGMTGACATSDDAAAPEASQAVSAPAATPTETSSPHETDTAQLCSPSCSSFNCQGRSLNAPCTLSTGKPGFCLNVSGNTCPVDGLITCACAKNLP
jgi:hypothetical protein